jgi:OmcA/MtrC family decaheme c-type cytochrome
MRISKRAMKIGILFLVFFMATTLAIAALVRKDGRRLTALDKAFYLTADETAYIRPGLLFTINSVTIPSDLKPLVTFTITDSLGGLPVDRAGIQTPGAVSSSFILAYLPPSTNGSPTAYVDYTSSTVTVNGNTGTQAGNATGGTYTDMGNGVYTYKFSKAIPANYNAAATHTLGIYGARNLTEWGLSTYVSDVTFDFVPNGSPVTQVHKVVLTANCNQCHDPLAAHGTTGRQAVEICILCHNPGTTDPGTGNALDMKVFIHKIHRGSSLPSVIAGAPYQIIGHNNAVSDFSTVVFPQDIRNCQTCHKGSAQTNSWMLMPSIEACGSCHDDLNFTTGVNHVGGPATNSQCASCHQPQGQYEFDPSVAGAHTVPYKSTQLLNPKVNVLSITNTAPGQHPVMKFTITDKNNNLLAPSLFTGTGKAFRINIAGPTTDYTTQTSETMSNFPAYVSGVATYTFNYTMPATATGTWLMETEARLAMPLVINGNPKNLTASQTDAAPNTLTFVAVTDKTPVPRRTVVSIDNCNKCHEALGKGSFDNASFHSNGRNQIVCMICHNPGHTSNGTTPATPISFQIMVHRIHTGENLLAPYMLGGTNFQEVRYPGDRRDCVACHVGTSYTVPLPATNIAVTTPNWYWTPTQPIAAACLACHDDISSAAHAFINTTTFGTITAESCPVCHQATATFSVSSVHAR